MSSATSASSSLVPPSWLCDDTAHVCSNTASGPSGAHTVQISQDDYDMLHLLEFSQIGHLLTHTSSSDMDAYIASLHKS